MKDEHFFVIQGWMINRLHLSGTELMVYAIINGFCQHGDGDGYIGGNATLMKWTGASARTISLTLQSLEEKGLITRSYIKTQRGRLGKIWTHGAEFAPPSEEKEGDSAESAPPIAQNLQDGSCKNCTTHDAKIAPITYTNNTYISPNGEREGRAERFAPPTLDEVRAYVRERGNKIDPEAFMAFYESNGWKVGKVGMKNWKAAVITWERREKKANEPKTPKGTFYQFEQRTYTEEEEKELEKKLLRKGRNR